MHLIKRGNNIVLAILLLTLNTFQAQSVDPLLVKDVESQTKWVDSILATMTVDEKIGQFLMVQAYSNLDSVHEQEVVDLLQKYHAGSLIFMQGTPKKQALLTNKYQAVAKIPLLVALDAEWGLDMRLKNAFRYPWNMTLGAIRDNDLIERFGVQLGKHCKRIGIHINFAPVVDININPKNPIIGNRSFGENKYNVTEKSLAFTTGIQSQNVMANAKHFPGHGDTASDSHHTLPVIDFDVVRLDTIELYPYKKLVSAGIGSIMTAHLSVPSLEPNKKLPSSLSTNIVTDLLQEKLGFKGLIITDGLNMKGAANYSSAEEINLAAILSGNDLLLIPHEIPATVKLFRKAIANGTLTKERLDFSVRKILKAKYWAGLHNYKPVDVANLHNDLHSEADVLLNRELVKNSITVLKNDQSILPIQHLDQKKIAYVKIGKAPNDVFVSMLKNYAKVNVISANNLDSLLLNLKSYNLVIIGYHSSNANPWKGFKFKSSDIKTIQAIAKENNVILDVFASPYSLLDMSNFDAIEGLIVSYQNSEVAQEISAQQIFGAVRANGKLPVTITKEMKEGFGLSTSSLSRLQYGVPEEVNMSSQKLKKIDSVAQVVIDEKMAPGMQILVARYGKVIYQKSFGYHTDTSKKQVKNSDIYDVASLTKILATLPMLMKAEGDGDIKISSRFSKLVPGLKKSNKDTLTLKEILSHNARLKAWIPFYKGAQDSITGKNLKTYYRNKKSSHYGIQVAKNMYLKTSFKDSIFKYIKNAEQREETGYKYSDLGYYLFKEYLESKYKQPLNELTQHYFYKSLGANRTSYLPLQKFSKKEIVPTEDDVYFRNQLLQGYVHDMGAAMQGGVGGHAGLFSNANDIAKIMQMYLQKGFYGGKRYLKSSTLQKFNKRYYKEKKIRRGLGFDKPQLDPETKATCGCVSEESFGHSGFTGAYTWADPKTGIVYVFLSNRVYPTMDNKGLIDFNIRTEIQQLIQNAILKE